MLLFLSLTQFMGAVTILLVKIAFKTYLSSLSLILTTMANSKRTVYMCQIQVDLRLPPREFSNSRFVWANGRAAGIGITIPVCSIGHLPLLEPLPSLPNIEWKRRQSFRNKMAEAANETSFEDFFF